MLEKKAARVALVCSTLAFFLLCGALVFFQYLPAILESILTPEIAKITRIQHLKFKVHKTGLNTIVSGPVTIGEKGDFGVSIHSVRVYYDLSRLLQKKVDRIIASGVTLNCAYGPSGFSIPGLDLKTLLKSLEKPALSPESGSGAVAGLPLNRLRINGGLVNLTCQNQVFRIPFEADMEKDGKTGGKVVIHIRIFPRGQSIKIDGVLDLENKTARVDAAAASVYMERFSDLIHQVPGLELSGRLDVKAGTDIGFSPFSLKNTRAMVGIKKGRARYKNILLSTGDSDKNSDAQVSISGNDKNAFQIEASRLKLVEPYPIRLAKSHVTLDLEKRNITAKGLADIFIHQYPLKNGAFELPGLSLQTSLKWAGAMDREGFWNASVSDRPSAANKKSQTLARLTGENQQVKIVSPDVDVSARGKGKKGSARWKLRFENLIAANGQTKATATYAAANGATGFSAGDKGLSIKTDARINLVNTRITAKEMTAGLPNFSLTMEAAAAKGDISKLTGRLKFSKAGFFHEPSRTRLEGIQLAFPIGFKNKTAVKKGVFSVKKVSLKDRPFGAIKGTLHQKGSGIEFDGVHDMAVLPGLKGVFSGKAAVETPKGVIGNVDFKIPEYQLPPEFDLGSLIPKAKDILASGIIGAGGRLSLSPSNVNGSLTAFIENGGFAIDEKKIVVEGVDAALRFPDIFNLQSEPNQHIRFTRAAIGDIAATNGRIDFQVASADTLFFEKIRFAWCDGNVETHAFTMRPEKKAYNITLYCDRLRLAKILEQLGSVNAKGTGTVNGRVPVQWSNNKFRFDDGFLYSTPGVDGKIRMSGTEILTRGIPMDTPQFAQIDLAAEALKDFDYKWAKLGLITEGENLLLKLQFDGKPARPLPFVYKAEYGGFVRVDAKSKGSLFQGIELDVNLRLPLNRLLEYKDVVNMIQ